MQVGSCVWAGDALGLSKWLCVVRIFAISHTLGFRASRCQGRPLAYMVSVVHFKTQKGTQGCEKKGIIIVAIGTQNGRQSAVRNGAKTALFVTGRTEQMLWER
jgi:ribosomal protein S11